VENQVFVKKICSCADAFDANNPDPAETTKTDPPSLSIGDICRL